MISVMAKVMRMGSKSLRGLLKNGKHPGKEKGSNSVRVLCYDSTSWVLDSFKPAVEEFNKKFGKSDFTIEMDYTTDRLSPRSSTYAAGYDAVCLFVNDNADSDIIKNLSLLGVKMIAMRCAGFDRVDTKAARAHQLSVARVPAYRCVFDCVFRLHSRDYSFGTALCIIDVYIRCLPSNVAPKQIPDCGYHFIRTTAI
jgi:hypothetical protein